MAELKKQTEFKLYKRDSVFFDQNTAPVNIAYAKEVNDVAILPLGAIEQHGPHCPNGLDSFNARPRRWRRSPAPPCSPAPCTAVIPTCTWVCLLPSR